MKDKLLPKSKFPLVLGITALMIALCAAAFSVYGISTLFAGAAISAMVMASALEIGKLVGTTFLYRYWQKCKFGLKSYLVSAILVLMVITSLGIFGYLSSAYQKSSIEYAVTQEKIKTTEQQKTYYQDKIVASKSRIDALTKLRSSQESRMSEVVTNEFLTRNPLQLKQLQQQTIDLITSTDKDIKEENDKIQLSIDDISKIDDKVNTMKLGSAEKKDVQTFKFVADALGMSLDQVARWFILMLIFVFDPLAICLILAYNVAVYKREDESVYDDIPQETSKILPEPKKITSTEPIVEPVIETPVVEKKQLILDSKPSNNKQEDNPREEATTDNTFFKSYFKK